MKRKITQIGRLFAAAALLFGASSWASAQETVTATYACTTAAIETATISTDGVLSSGTMAVASGWDFSGTKAINGVTFMRFGPASKMSDTSLPTVRFTLNVENGVTFTPTSVAFNAARFGSDSGNQLDVYAVKADGSKVKLNAETLEPLRDNSGSFLTTTLPITDITGSVAIEFNFKCDAGKQVGLNNVVITGTYTLPEAFKVAYLAGTNATECNEAIFNALQADPILEVTALNYDDKTLTGDLTADGLADYDLVVISGPTGSKTSLATSFDKILGKIPVLNTKAFWYNKTSPAIGGGGANPGTAENPSMTLIPDYLYVEHDIFAGLSRIDTVMPFAKPGREGGRYLQGIPSETTFEHDVIATANGAASVAEHWFDGNIGYLIIPVDGEGAEYTVLDGALTEDGARMFVNAAKYLLWGEPYVLPIVGTCATEIKTTALEGEWEGYYELTITATPDTAKIYYTTDGTVPTTESKLYTAPDTLLKNCLVQAIAVSPEKWYDSPVDSLEFVNETLAALPAPVITLAQNAEGKCVDVTIAITSEELDLTGAQILYTLDGTDPIENGEVYSAPFAAYGDTITVMAAAVSEKYNNSPVAIQGIKNENYVAREKVFYSTDFHNPIEEWFYNADFTYDENGEVIAGTVKPGAVWPEGIGFSNSTEKDGFRVHVFNKGNTYVGYRQYNGWSFYGEKDRRLILQSDNGAYFLNKEGKTGAAPDTLFQGPFDVELDIRAKVETPIRVMVGDELEGTEWQVLDEIVVPNGAEETVRFSYNGTDKKYVRFESEAKEFYVDEYRILVEGYGELELQSVSPAGSTAMAEAVLIADTTTTFVVTFNNPLAETQADNLIVYFGVPAMPATNCTYAINGNTMTITRQGTEPLAGATYQLVVQNVTDVVGQTYARLSQFYKVETTSSGVTAPEVEKEVVSTVIYSISGAVQSELTQGLNFVRTVYSDGSVEVEKVIVK